MLLTADICAAWVDCLTAAMDDAAPLRAPGTQQGALEPIAKFRATDGHAQVRRRASDGLLKGRVRATRQRPPTDPAHGSLCLSL